MGFTGQTPRAEENVVFDLTACTASQAGQLQENGMICSTALGNNIAVNCRSFSLSEIYFLQIFICSTRGEQDKKLCVYHKFHP